MEAMRRGVCEGMQFYSADGKHIGRVARCGNEHFEVEHGFFFPKEDLVSWSDVAEVRGKTVVSRLTRKELRDMWRRLNEWGPGTWPPQQA